MIKENLTGESGLPDGFFRELNNDEEAEFRAWARDNYTPGEKVKACWHPALRDECRKMNEEVGIIQ